MKDNSIKNVIVVAVIIVVFSGCYFLLKMLNSNKEDNELFLKNYEVNEYINMYISDEDMARIYLNDYIWNMQYDVENAYELLDDEYKQKKFGNIENYKNYVKNLQYKTYTLSKYYKRELNDIIIFGVYDTHDNLFIFKTNGVMQYKVYLDDYTVEI